MVKFNVHILFVPFDPNSHPPMYIKPAKCPGQIWRYDKRKTPLVTGNFFKEKTRIMDTFITANDEAKKSMNEGAYRNP